MTGIFQTILIMSTAGSVLALVLLAAKPLTGKFFSPTWQYYIWLAVLLAMLIPIHLPLAYDPIAEYNQGQALVVETTAIQEVTPLDPTAGNEAVFEGKAEPQNVTPAASSTRFTDLLRQSSFPAWLWLAGFVIILSVRLIRYLIFLRIIHRGSKPYACTRPDFPRLPIRQTALLDAPVIVGLFNPTLFLPRTDLNEQALHYIISHEATHYRRRDLLYKWLTMVMCSLHWFNPLAYIISRQIDEACEISCDYAVTKNLNPAEKTDYMQTILSLLTNSRRPLTTQMASGKKTITRRFTMIKSIKKRSKAVTFISILIAALLLSGTALASGMAQNAATDDYQITIRNHGKEITLTHKPFVENNTVYLPLREMLNLENISDDNITYENGVVEFIIPAEGGTEYRGVTYDNWINRVSTKSRYGYLLGHSHGSTGNTTFIQPSLLRDGTVYVPYDVIAKLADSDKPVFGSTYVEYQAKNKNLPPLDGTIYANDNFDYNFSLRLPLEWSRKYMVVEEANADNHRVYFYQKDAYTKDQGKSGLLFYVQIQDGLHHSTNGDFVMHVNNKTYSFGYPTDEQIKKINYYTLKEYKEMAALIKPYITQSIEVIVSYTPPEGGDPYNLRTGTFDAANFLDSAEAYAPSDTIDDFFYAFAAGDINAMRQFCTDDCIKKFFQADRVFGMTRATLSDYSIDEKEYAKSSNDFNVLVTVNMTPAKNSVFPSNQTSTSFYVKMLRQPNGYYLINEFATGL